MALTATSSFNEIIEEYRTAAEWEATGNVTLAQRFVVACTHLLVELPAATTKDGESVQYQPQIIENQQRRARHFLAVANTSQVVHPDFGDFRR